MERVTIFKWAVFLVFLVSLYGCAGNRKALEEQLAYQNNTIAELQKANSDLQAKLAEKDAEVQQSAQKPSQNLENLKRVLESQLGGTGVIVRVRGDEIVLSLDSARLFDPGQCTMKPGAKPILNKVAKVIKTQSPAATVRVEGHTDNRPIRKQKNRFKSNWELSAARASSVLHYLIDNCHMNPKKVYMAGLGEHHPVASNSTPAGRQKNRRVEIVVIPQESA